MAAKRALNEDDYTRAALSREIARLRSDAVVLDRFLAFAETEGGVDRARFLPRLRVIFSGRAAPAFIALLIQKFFSHHLHLGIQREVCAGVEFRATPSMLPILKAFAFSHPGVDVISSWAWVPEGQVSSGSIYGTIHKPSLDDEAAKAAGLDQAAIAKRTKAYQKWFSKELESWPDVYERNGERHSVFYRMHRGYDPLDPYAADEDSKDDAHDQALYLWEACALLDVVHRGESFCLFSPLIDEFYLQEFSRIAKEDGQKRSCDGLRELWEKPESHYLHWLAVLARAGRLPALLQTAFADLRASLIPRSRRLERSIDEILLYAHEDTILRAPPLLRADFLLARNEINRATSSFYLKHAEEMGRVLERLLAEGEAFAAIESEALKYVTPTITATLGSITDDEIDAFLHDCSYQSSRLAMRCIRSELQKPAPSARTPRYHFGLDLKKMVLEMAAGAGPNATPYWLSAEGAYTISAELYGALRVKYDAVAELTSATDYGVLKVRLKGSKANPVVFDVKLEQNVRERWEQEESEIFERIRRFVTVLRNANSVGTTFGRRSPGQPAITT
ncbi:hypothetical protein [Geminisphaera colitermitum]|uniref:hypothetical protein n=1 Tax=Geminisphaera colitermitum TaxID=1148786 RepID=UPI000158CB76|nr:hypothetical protein [Geminisphaera colitermitum]